MASPADHPDPWALHKTPRYSPILTVWNQATTAPGTAGDPQD